MFSSEESLKRRTGPHGTGRLKYLQALVTEYQDTGDKGKEVLCLMYADLACVKYHCWPFPYIFDIGSSLAMHCYVNHIEQCTCKECYRDHPRLGQGGVTPIPSVLRSVTVVKPQVNRQGSFKVKGNGQTFLVDIQSYVNK